MNRCVALLLAAGLSVGFGIPAQAAVPSGLNAPATLAGSSPDPTPAPEYQLPGARLQRPGLPSTQGGLPKVPAPGGAWSWQSPLPNGNPLFAISCPTASTCFSAGLSGPILMTGNGGATWTQQATTNEINAISCPSTSVCFAVGDFGVVMRTLDSGANWSSATINSGNFLAGVSCPTTADCYAVGYAGSIWHTGDGGATWTPQSSGTVNTIYAIKCPAISICTAVGASGTIVRTPGGGSWVPQGSSTTNILTAVSCPTTSACTAVGQGGVIRYTTDQGSTWNGVYPGAPVTLLGVSCPALGACFASGVDGDVYLNIGSGWGHLSTAETSVLYAISCPTAAACFAAGSHGVVVATTNGGTGWMQQSPTTYTDYGAISCPTAPTCVVMGNSGNVTLKTTDGGATWPHQGLATITTGSPNNVSCPSATTCFAVGQAGAISKTVDGAVTWNAQSSGSTNYLASISCPSTTACFVVGNGGTILATADGAAWSVQTSGTTLDLRSVSCPTTSVCFAVPGGAPTTTILATTNGGTTWTIQSTPIVYYLAGISCPSTTTCFAVSGYSNILATTNGGALWTAQTSGTTAPLYAISCPSTTTCFATGDSVILGTTNGGTTWASQGPGGVLTSLSCPTVNTCYATASIGSGKIFGTTNGGTNWRLLAPSGTTETVTGMSCPSTTTCFATSGNITGTVLRMTNGGGWLPVFSTYAYVFKAISCPSTSACFAVGKNCCLAGGAVIATADGGTTWTVQLTSNSDSLTAISCASATECIAVAAGGTFTKTINGTSWSVPSPISGATSLSGISCPSASVCFATDASITGLVFSTINGGSTWVQSFNLALDPQAGIPGPFAAINCPSTTNCFASGAGGLIAATSDGGTNWRTDNVPSTALLTAISCANGSTCFVSANDSTILHTTDYGGTWEVQYGGASTALGGYNAISCPSAAVCLAGGGGGVISATTTGGAAWAKQQPAGTINDIRGMSCYGLSNCYAAANGNLLATHNGGGTWAALTLGTTDLLGAISCPGANTCFAVGWPAAILKTIDGGTTWTLQAHSLYGSDNTFLGVSCASVTNCVLVGSGGIILSTTNGATWSSESSGTTAPLFGVSCPSTYSCIAVGAGGLTLTRSGGAWSASPSGTTNTLRGVSCGSVSTCYAVGYAGTVRVTTNRGASWTVQTSGTTQNLFGISCAEVTFCLAAGNFGAAIITVDGGLWKSLTTSIFNHFRAVAFPDLSRAWLAGLGGTILANTTLTPNCAPVGPAPASRAVSSNQQYSLANSDGASWQEIDAVNLRVYCNPTATQNVLLTANADLWTANAGYNQDLGIFVSDSGAPDQLLAWKESGGSAGTFSPNAAFVQTLYSMSTGHTYIFKLKWKTNQPAPGATIYASAGSGSYSPTSLIAKTFTTAPNFAVSTKQYSLTNSDGVNWTDVDATTLSTNVAPAANSVAVLGANVDLFTAKTGYNQDIGIFVSDNGGADQLVAWKESGGFAGTFSPNAAFVKATYAMTGSHTYTFKLKWKTNGPAAGATIYAAAGNSPYSQTSLVAEIETSPSFAVSAAQYSLSGSDGVNWQPISVTLDVPVNPSVNYNSIVGANADLWTANAGFNQDIGIFVTDNGGPEVLVAWKESGGLAGTFSPNAAFVQAWHPMTAGHAYVFKLKWKTNQPASGATIYTAAGNGATGYSPTRLTVELTS